MSRTHLVGSLFVVVAILIAASGYPAMTSARYDAAAPAPMVDLQVLPADDGLCSAEDHSSVSEAEDAACSRCPDGSPSCWTDKQCDSVCGGKGSGVCQRINSCYKCCLCAF